MPRRLVWIALAAALLLSTGCGKKGPLYLPDQPADDTDSQSDIAPRDNP